MVDYFSLALTHALMALAVWRLLLRDDLDRDPDPAQERTSDTRRPRPATGVSRTLRLPNEATDGQGPGPGTGSDSHA